MTPSCVDELVADQILAALAAREGQVACPEDDVRAPSHARHGGVARRPDEPRSAARCPPSQPVERIARRPAVPANCFCASEQTAATSRKPSRAAGRACIASQPPTAQGPWTSLRPGCAGPGSSRTPIFVDHIRVALRGSRHDALRRSGSSRTTRASRCHPLRRRQATALFSRGTASMLEREVVFVI